MNKEEIYDLLNRLDLPEWCTELYKVPLTWCELYDIRDYIINLEQQCKKQKVVIDKAIEYINKYAWQEDIIGGIYTTTGKPAIDRYMKLEWDNCNELLEILKEVSE